LDSTTKSLSLQHNGQKLSFYDPSDLLINIVKGKPVGLVFQADTVQMINVNDSILVNTDLHVNESLPCKIDNEKGGHLILHLGHMMLCSRR
jgi:hypothetical protein